MQISDNAIDAMLRMARAESWCLSWPCTTCGAHEVASRYAMLARDGDTFVAMLLVSDPTLWLALGTASAPLALIPHHLVGEGLLERLLAGWAQWIEDEPRFADAIFFRIVRQMQPGSVRSMWTRRFRAEALRLKDPSMLESLLWGLGMEAARDPELLAVVRSLAPFHRPLAKALRHALGISSSAPRVT